jgi:hypothetical protein
VGEFFFFKEIFMKTRIISASILIASLASCGQQTQPEAVQANNTVVSTVVSNAPEKMTVLATSSMVFKGVTDRELIVLAGNHPELSETIDLFMKKSSENLKNPVVSDNTLSTQSGFNFAGCRGDVTAGHNNTGVESIFGTYCASFGSKTVIASSARQRFENITSGLVQAKTQNDPGGNNFIDDYMTDPPGDQLFCAKGWMLVTLSDGSKLQGETSNACFTN